MKYEDLDPEEEIEFLENWLFSELIDQVCWITSSKQKGEITEYDCYILENFILTVQKRPEYKKYLKKMEKEYKVSSSISNKKTREL